MKHSLTVCTAAYKQEEENQIKLKAQSKHPPPPLIKLTALKSKSNDQQKKTAELKSTWCQWNSSAVHPEQSVALVRGGGDSVEAWQREL